MDTHAVSINYEKIMSAMVGESSKFENELLEHTNHTRNINDSSQVDITTQQQVINTTEYQPVSLDYIMVQESMSDVEGANKSLDKWTNKDMNETMPSLTEDVTSQAASENFCAVNDILTIFPFVCGICDEKFRCISNYLKHISIHEKMNAFLHCCSELSTGIGEKNSLFSCGICSTKFPTLCTLYKHMIESESVHDFVFLNSEKTVYAYREDIAENALGTKNVAHTYRTRNNKTEIEPPSKGGNVNKLNINNYTLCNSGNQLDAIIAENIVEKASNKEKKCNTYEKITKRNQRTCHTSKKKGSFNELDVNNVSATGKKKSKRKGLIRENCQTKINMDMSSFSGKTHTSSNEVDNTNAEDDDEVKVDYNIDAVDDNDVDDDDDDDYGDKQIEAKHLKVRIFH